MVYSFTWSKCSQKGPPPVVTDPVSGQVIVKPSSHVHQGVMFTQRKNDIHHNDSQMFSAFFNWDFHVRAKLHLSTRIFSRRTRQTQGQVDIFSRCCHVDLLRCSHCEMFSFIDVHILICSPVGILSCSLSGSHPPHWQGRHTSCSICRERRTFNNHPLFTLYYKAPSNTSLNAH